jgi:hypothetical protein
MADHPSVTPLRLDTFRFEMAFGGLLSLLAFWRRLDIGQTSGRIDFGADDVSECL